MAHKSHRQKALQAQLESQPAISLVSSSKRAPIPKPTPSSSKTLSTQPDAEEAGSEAEDGDMEVDDEVLIAPTSGSSKGKEAESSTAAGGSSSGFAPLPASATSLVLKNEFRRVPIPPHRMSPLKRDWVNLYTPMVEMLGLQVRMNVKRRAVELKVSDCPHSRRAIPSSLSFARVPGLGLYFCYTANMAVDWQPRLRDPPTFVSHSRSHG